MEEWATTSSAHWPSHCVKTQSSQLQQAILRVANITIGRAPVKRKNTCWMTTEVRQAIKERNRLARNITAHREEWVEACRQVTRLTREAKEKKWHDFLEDMDWNTDNAIIWGTVRSLSDAQ